MWYQIAVTTIAVAALNQTTGFAQPDPSSSRSATNGSASVSTTVTDLDGHAIDPLADPKSKAVVLIFVCTDCPIANRYAPEIKQLSEGYGRKGVAFWLVYADPGEDVAKIRKHLHDYQHSTRALRDAQHRLVAFSGASKTPDAAVFAPGRRRVYLGRIDNRFTDYGKARNAATEHDLEDAINCVLAGRPVKKATTETIGCSIPKAEQ